MPILLPHTNQVCESLVDALQHWSAVQPNDMLYRFLSSEDDSIQTMTYGALAEQAKAIAVTLQQKKLQPGDRVILIYPPGLELISAYFGCLYAGITAVPVYPPLTPYLVEKLQRVLVNSQSKLLLTTSSIQEKLQQLKLLKQITFVPILKKLAQHYFAKRLDLAQWDVEKINWLSTNDIDSQLAKQWQSLAIKGDHLAFLQYTSGSTGHPKGVMLTHSNLLNNLSILHQVCRGGRNSSGVNWLPPYHDMGLIGVILLAIFMGCSSTLMSPISFLRNPKKWLKAISDYRVSICAAPNFAYDYCVSKIKEEDRVGLDLSSWEVALNGAEPIHFETLERFYQAFKQCGFRKEAIFPCYGLAEATLYVSGSGCMNGFQYNYFSDLGLQQNRVEPLEKNALKAKAIVSCGIPSQEVVIVDPNTCERCAPNAIGEIWIKGPSVAKGYWQNAEETEAVFHARIQPSGQDEFLRTGDLGFLYQGQLYITGRIKDLIIIHGMNYYPQDIEHTVNHSHSSIRNGCTAAFTVTTSSLDSKILTSISKSLVTSSTSKFIDEEKIIIVTELTPNHEKSEENYRKICEVISQAIAENHELAVHSILLIKAKTLPKTTSGKLRRRHTKTLFENQQLDVLFQWQAGEIQIPKTEIREPATAMEAELLEMCSKLLERPVTLDENFSYLGVDSLLATQLLSRIREQYDVELPIHNLFECKSISDLAKLIEKTKNAGQ